MKNLVVDLLFFKKKILGIPLFLANAQSSLSPSRTGRSEPLGFDPLGFDDSWESVLILLNKLSRKLLILILLDWLSNLLRKNEIHFFFKRPI